MSKSFIVTGTDTDIGKTIFCAGLVDALDGYYWKPVQAGLADGGDAATVSRLSGLDSGRILNEAYRLNTPCSPHQAAQIDGVVIDSAALALPKTDGALIIEGAGGALVPLSSQLLYADQFAMWKLPVIIAARTALGTINHCLLTIEALRARGVPVHGIAFIGERNLETEAIIASIGQVRNLGCLPIIDPLNADNLRTAFAQNFNVEDFR
jgi:dethiobiotin synthetase